MDEITIRVAGPADARTLSELGWATFLNTFVEGFGMPYSADDLAEFHARAYAVDRAEALLADRASRAWLAERGGEPVGFATAGPAALPHTELRPGDRELRRLYVRADQKGAGLAPRLMETAMTWLLRDGPRPVWLGVWSGNHRAQRFYARYGFEKVGEYGYPVGEVTDHEFIMRRPASAGRLAA